MRSWRSLPVILVMLLVLTACSKKSSESTLFSLVPPEDSGITFSNDLVEDEQFNIIEYLYFYNGGGVACGDINNDGLIDLYFSSNQKTNRLYLNKGNLKFEDITERSGAGGIGNWKTGITMADVNGDGFLDIYVCGVDRYKSFKSRNQLLINNGNLTFTDRTTEFGLDFSGRSTQAAFFDFDLDGDLDCYLLNHSVHDAGAYISITHRFEADSLSGDQLFRNELIKDGVAGVPRFANITRSSGIFSSRLGYGLGIGISDINLDGYPDIYVSNDFQENDYLYLNNRNGTFRQVLEKSMAHSSRFSMGVDIADFNNDGRPDIVSMDMLPRSESVIKTSAGEDAYEVYKYKLGYGYHYQVARNCLHVNRLITDSAVLFSDVALQAGVAATDWSWSPLMADFDRDGLKDLFVSNGILRRPNDLDYIHFISNRAIQNSLKSIDKSDLDILDEMPSGQVSNFIFKNDGGLHYSDQTKAWGLNRVSISNGAAYADFDNDGDLDLITNNLNEPASLYVNHSDASSGYLKISLMGNRANKFGLGCKVLIYANEEKSYYEVSSARGFCSSSDTRINVGLGGNKQIDSLIIIWPGDAFQKLENINVNQKILVREDEATGNFNYLTLLERKPMMSALDGSSLPDFIHHEDDFNAFNSEGLIPHMLTTEGPPLSKGDVNADGFDDIFIGGGRDQRAALYFQTSSGGWKAQPEKDFRMNLSCEDTASELVDVDGDKDLDLIIVSGGQDPSAKLEDLRPRLLRNDGAGNFGLDLEAMPKLSLNASCVKSCDFDADGDMDLFVGASVIPSLYGMAPTSYLFVNDGRGNFSPAQGWLGQSKFDNPSVVRPGMVKDAAWTDVNKDGRPDLVLVGEWMPITILIQNDAKQFENRTTELGMQMTNGWWNSIVAADMDHDGDDDYVVGNLGLNSRLTASPERPVKLYLGDFDSNGGSDHIITYFNDSLSYPFASRDQLVKQLPGMKKRFLNYRDYRDVDLKDIITPELEGNSAEMRADVFASSYIRNDNVKLVRTALPEEAQIAPIFAVSVEDVNDDSHADLIVGGNLMATQPDFGPYDSSIGLVLLGNGKGDFTGVDAMQSGFFVTGEVRDIQLIRGPSNQKTVIISRNNRSLAGYRISSQ